ncbi:AraC family transcriptional regulator [Gramella sp. BOM4]|nr:AraC family transcriptional regulator [Christiangramia bathymodioli]
MKTYNIDCIPIDKVMSELADLFQTDLVKKCDECTINIPPQLGDGYIKGVVFDKGIGFINYSCEFKEDVQINFLKNKIHPLKFLYVLEGELEHYFEETGKKEILEQFQYCLVAGKSNLAHSIRFIKNVRLSFNSLEINRREFYDSMSCSIEKMKPTVKRLLKDLDSRNAYYHKGYYYLEMADLFRQLKDISVDKGYRKIYMERIVHGMLLTQLMEFHSEVNSDEEREILKRNEVRSLEEAHKIIENEIDNLPKIREIAYRVGLNANKLQFGFRRMHRKSINSYVQERRLKISKKLLLQTNLNMAEISDKVGISSKSYFSKLFKEKYELTPYEFRKKYKKQPKDDLGQ